MERITSGVLSCLSGKTVNLAGSSLVRHQLLLDKAGAFKGDQYDCTADYEEENEADNWVF